MARNSIDKQDNFIRNLLLGFGGAIVVLVVATFVITAMMPKYSDHPNLDNFNQITTQEEEKYLVYYYSDDCSYCDEIKSEVLDFMNEEKDIKIYVINSAKADGTRLINPADSNYYLGTPTFLTIENGSIVDYNSGVEDIPKLILDINAGNYAYFD